jgi:transcriptional regulator with XRE-family HTH domain
MQALSAITGNDPYNAGMQTGRPAKTKRSDFGAQLHAAREAKGLSQAQMADKLGLAQQSYAAWERRNVALRADQLQQLAGILGVGVDQLLGHAAKPARAAGPVGKLRQVFESASKLPRHQQAKVAEFVQAFVAQQQKAS